MDGLTEGRIVHYVLPDAPLRGEHRPAIVVKVWNKGAGLVNLQQFTDGQNDGYARGTAWREEVPYSETPTPNTWHWIEKA